MLSLSLQEQILELHRLGVSKPKIAERTGVHWETVAKLVKRGYAVAHKNPYKAVKYVPVGICRHCGGPAPCIPCLRSHTVAPQKYKNEEYEDLRLELQPGEHERYLEVMKVA